MIRTWCSKVSWVCILDVLNYVSEGYVLSWGAGVAAEYSISVGVFSREAVQGLTFWPRFLKAMVFSIFDSGSGNPNVNLYIHLDFRTRSQFCAGSHASLTALQHGFRN